MMGDSSGLVIRCTCAAILPTMPTCRDFHMPGCPAFHLFPGDGEKYARWALANPERASVEMSGMSDTDLLDLRREFG